LYDRPKRKPQNKAPVSPERNGARGSPEYAIYTQMKCACYYPGVIRYRITGARGIRVCPQWLNSFQTFLRDVGKKPGPHSQLWRIDLSGDYRPDNVFWKESVRDQLVTYGGETRPVFEWLSILGIPNAVFRVRHSGMKWPLERCIFQRYQPSGPYRSRRAAVVQPDPDLSSTVDAEGPGIEESSPGLVVEEHLDPLVDGDDEHPLADPTADGVGDGPI